MTQKRFDHIELTQSDNNGSSFASPSTPFQRQVEIDGVEREVVRAEPMPKVSVEQAASVQDAPIEEEASGKQRIMEQLRDQLEAELQMELQLEKARERARNACRTLCRGMICIVALAFIGYLALIGLDKHLRLFCVVICCSGVGLVMVELLYSRRPRPRR